MELTDQFEDVSKIEIAEIINKKIEIIGWSFL